MIGKAGFWGGLATGALVCAVVGLGIWLRQDLAQETSFTEEMSPTPNPNDTPPAERGVVAEIIDGITIKLEDGHVIRYLGVRVPGVQSKVECFGREVLAAQEAIIGKEVRMAIDPALERASDGAWVRYVYMVDDKKKEELEAKETETTEPEMTMPEVTPTPDLLPPQAEDEILINERILEGGFGFPLVSEDVILADRLLSAARYASATSKGLWKQCEVTKNDSDLLVTNELTKCVIKGTKSVMGKNVYRTDECRLYAKTIVLPSQGGQWFCSEDEAAAAGFEKAGDCN